MVQRDARSLAHLGENATQQLGQLRAWNSAQHNAGADIGTSGWWVVYTGGNEREGEVQSGIDEISSENILRLDEHGAGDAARDGGGAHPVDYRNDSAG